VTGVPQLVWRGVGAGQWTWASPQWTEYTGQSLEQSRGWGWLEPVHPDDRETARAEWAAAAGDGSFSAEYRLLNHAEQRYRWFRTRATPVRNRDGSISEWLGTSTDVDDLRRLQQRQQVLVDELQHRTRNLMGVISALSRRTVASSDSLDTYAASFDDRLAALSRANNLLSRLGEGERISFDTLIRTELDALGAFEHSVGTVELDGSADIYLRSRTVQIFALALHELGTNAVKYGALARSGARLSLRWRREEQPGQAPQLLLEWRESGFAVPAPQRSGYGRELIERALPYQLGAQTRLEYGVDGVTCVIRVPIWARRRS
jgi:PAS domain S-box-containing protein